MFVFEGELPVRFGVSFCVAEKIKFSVFTVSFGKMKVKWLANGGREDNSFKPIRM